MKLTKDDMEYLRSHDLWPLIRLAGALFVAATALGVLAYFGVIGNG